ncbi:alginate export family protein [Xanthomonas campestris]|uniref:alginate export family protein n=1 Tax=Xanthomonas campestris TaxID=339 RepID=UPI001E5D886A|nr:alginate export family protein [Xanthomonas campestris]MCC4604750.1 alginate export family protein [Xanthomonas campestris pv. parthenii]
MTVRLALPLIALLCAHPAACAQTPLPAGDAGAARPKIASNRWQEDWSPLANPALRTQPLDRLKFVPLGDAAYASFGLNLRERFESNDAPALGIGRQRDSDVLQRLQAHVDLRVGAHWQLFTQLEDARAFDKRQHGPADANRADLRMAFVAYNAPVGNGRLKWRVGRQEFAFDLQRFVSLRDGPNVRQSFDAAWVNYETGPWRVIAFVSQPVQYADERSFDDVSNGHLRFDSVRIERHVLGTNELSLYYARYRQDDAGFLDASGNERRHILDARFAGAHQRIDWDVEAMGQRGRVGSSRARAWAVGLKAGYTWKTTPLTPRLGLQVDTASGDHRPGDGRVETFNPLFPNGAYINLAGYTGYANLLLVKPALTVQPSATLSVTAAMGLLWRQRTADAVYVQPDIPLAGTAGTGKRWTGRYLQLRGDWKLNAHLQTALEVVQYQAGQSVRAAGGHNSRYLGCEMKFMW